MYQRLNTVRLRRIHRELKDFENSKDSEVDGVMALSCVRGYEDTLDHVYAVLKGPVDSPFEDLSFRVLIKIPEAYPMDPPGISFMDVPYHPNISSRGAICVSFLKSSGSCSWSPGMSMRSALIALRSLLADAAADDPLNPDAASHWVFAKELGRWDSYRSEVLRRLAAAGHAEALEQLGR